MFTTVAEQQCVGIKIVEDLYAFCGFVHVNLSYGVDTIQGVGLYVKDIAESVRMIFVVDTGDWCQCTLGEASEFMSFKSHFGGFLSAEDLLL